MKITVITAVFNSCDTIEDALASVRHQNYPNIEHVVIDGASTDGTLQVLESRRSSIAILLSERDSGIYDALNKGIRLASGDVVGFLHADDQFADCRVVSRIAQAFHEPSVQAVYGDLIYVSKSDTSRVIRRWHSGAYSSRRLSWGWMPPHPTFYLRRSVYEQLGGFDTTFQISADYDCMLRLLGRGAIVPKYIPEVLVRMRMGGASNRSIRNVIRKSAEDYRALTNNGIGGIGSLAWKNLSKIGQFLG